MRFTLSAAFAASLMIAPALSAQQNGAVLRTVASAPQESAQATSQPRRVRISGGVMAGQLLTHVDPTYPEEGRASATSGTVVLHVIVAPDGTVEEISVISGPQVFQRSAVDAVKQWTYKPFLLNGEPAEVDTTVTVNFNLQATSQP